VFVVTEEVSPLVTEMLTTEKSKLSLATAAGSAVSMSAARGSCCAEAPEAPWLTVMIPEIKFAAVRVAETVAAAGAPWTTVKGAMVRRVVKLPVFGAVLPIGGGEEKFAVLPAPAYVSAVTVVNVAARFVVAPIVMLSMVPAAPALVGGVNGNTTSPREEENKEMLPATATAATSINTEVARTVAIFFIAVFSYLTSI
jgi:hypothetical protein